jgi:hypothetical protein
MALNGRNFGVAGEGALSAIEKDELRIRAVEVRSLRFWSSNMTASGVGSRHDNIGKY